MVLKFTAQITASLQRSTRHPLCHHAEANGFTLVELLLSISILMILAAISLPQLNGIYERQKLTNAANEIVTDIKTLQNKALANNQDRFAALSPDAPITDCTADYPLVSGYVFEINSAGDAYFSNFDFKDKDNTGTVTCAKGTERIATKLLPDGVHFRVDDGGRSVRYQTVSGQILLDKNSAQSESKLLLTSDRIDESVLSYCIIINLGRVYLEQNAECVEA